MTLEEARAELAGIAAQLAQQYPDDNEGWSVRLVTFYDWLIPEQTRESLIVLQGAVALVLLIACVNVANLLLAQRRRAQRELAIRVAVGASRARILWHGLMESLLLGVARRRGGPCAGGAPRFACCRSTPRAIVPRVDEASIDWAVMIFAAVCAIAAAAVFGLLPSLHAAREHGPGAARDEPRSDRRAQPSADSLHADGGGSGLVGRPLDRRRAAAPQLRSLQRVDPGFDVEAVMTGRVMLASPTAFDTRTSVSTSGAA